MALRPLKGPFTVDTYQRLAELGVLREDERVELIDGQVVAMSPIGDRHASCVRRLNRLLSRALVHLAIIDVQNPVVLGEYDVPRPDLALLKARVDAYPRHPRARDTLLLIEVADSSVPFDRDVKIPLYARAGIPEVWLVDLRVDQIEVYRDPIAGTYASVRSASRGDTLTLLHLSNVTVAADEILG
jgi:Uma2 family endonuclease